LQLTAVTIAFMDQAPQRFRAGPVMACSCSRSIRESIGRLIVIVRCSRFFVMPHRVVAKPGPLFRTML
jgi:hypothetical protein